jgi:hypothetical protein
MRYALFTRKTVAVVARLVAALVFTMSFVACRNGQSETADTWDIEGTLLAWDTGVWIVDTIPIVVPDGVTLNESPILGATVVASGIFDHTGQRVAAEVNLSSGGLPQSTLPEASLTGSIDRVEEDRWIVSGQDVIVPPGSQIRSDDPASEAASLIQIGTIAQVAGNQLDDGRIIAWDIVLYPPVTTARPESTDATDTDEPAPAEEQPEQSLPDPAAPDDAENHDGDDNGGSPGNDDNHEKENKEKPQKPDKPDKPDKAEKSDKPGNGNGRDNDKKEKP